ncbi:MAG: hypothetical protein GY856_15640 [bacterium]|nr:hypothetical protein [bacterium]
MDQQLCLYCFEDFNPWEMLVRCRTDEPGRCKPEVDDRYDDYWDLEASEKIPRGRLSPIPDPGRFRRALSALHRQYPCPECKQKSNLLCCPYCHNSLPHPHDRSEEIIISIIGGPQSGKTVYLSLLVDEFNRTMTPRYSLRPLGEEVTKRYDRIYRGPIKDRTLPGATQRSRVDPEVRHPLTFTLGEAGDEHERTRTIVIHDAAGEQFRHQDQMRRFNRYLIHSHGAMIFVDPEQMPKVRERMTDPPPRVTGRALDLLNTVHDMVVDEQDLRQRTLDLPLAIVLTKIDLLQDPAAMGNAPFLTPGFTLLERTEHGPEFIEDHAKAVHDEIDSLLKILREGDVIGSAANMFSSYLCFGISSLGHCPNRHNNTLTGEPEPMRLLDPFLWLLARLNCIEYVE